MVRLVVKNQFCQIQGTFPEDVVRRATSYPVQGYAFMPSWRKRKWDGRKHLLLGPENIFPAGLVDAVRDALERAGSEVTLEDVTEYPPAAHAQPALIDLPGEGCLRDYQTAGIRRAIERRRGILRIATGGGKTILAAGLISQMGLPTVFLTESVDLLTQTRQVFERHLRRPIGVIGDGSWEESEITVASVQTLAGQMKPDGRARAFLKTRRLVIFDETHHAASDSSFRVLMGCPAPWRLGLSATPTGRSDRADLRTIATIGPVIYDVPARELVQAGVLVKPVVEFVSVSEPQLPPGIGYQDAYRQGIVENTTRNGLAAARARDFAGLGYTVLALVRQIDHGQALLRELRDAGVRAEFIYGGGSTAEERRETLDRLRDGRLTCLIASEIFDEGIDVPSVDALILAGGGKSEIQVVQRIGRGMRRGKKSPVLEVVEFADMMDPRLARHALERLRTYRREGIEIRYAGEQQEELTL